MNYVFYRYVVVSCLWSVIGPEV